jgi:DNA-directed RNA polymerase subunit RPC12/RpoP
MYDWSSLQRMEKLFRWSLIATALSLGVVVLDKKGRLPFGTTCLLVSAFLSMAFFWGSLGFRCPRCGKQFFRDRWYSNAAANQCVHCGLHKGQTDNE